MKEIDFLDFWTFKKYISKCVEIIKYDERVIVVLNKKEKHIFSSSSETNIRINIEKSRYIVRINAMYPYKKYDYMRIC